MQLSSPEMEIVFILRKTILMWIFTFSARLESRKSKSNCECNWRGHACLCRPPAAFGPVLILGAPKRGRLTWSPRTRAPLRSGPFSRWFISAHTSALDSCADECRPCRQPGGDVGCKWFGLWFWIWISFCTWLGGFPLLTHFNQATI